MARRLVALGAALLAGLTLASAAHARNPQIAGLQVALRAYGLYNGPIDAIAGPLTVRATKKFQRRAGLVPDGRAGPATRRALGPLGTPVFGRRTLHRGSFGWDVSVLQYMLARRGRLVPVYGFFDAATERALRSYQRARRLTADGIAGPRTLRALGHATPGVRPTRPARHATPAAPATSVRTMLTNWAIAYRLDPALVRALGWMESGFQTGLVSSAGARGVLQVLPVTRGYVEHQLIGHKVPRSTSGNIRIGVVYLRQLLREFGWDRTRALAAWYQGPASVRKRGQLASTKLFVANVLALSRRDI
ncbi:MAG TPA: peptidoglycan-binding protein [Gaiellaceae bacterium]|nr:peptidoglycan-binding protein [Gaiellaceae bacterium]